jgi:hypothetical protein
MHLKSVEELPELIAEAERKVCEAREEFERKKLKVELEKAKFMLMVRTLKATEIEKRARVKVMAFDLENELIGFETKVKLAEIEFNKLVNTFIALRKQISFQMSEMENLG